MNGSPELLTELCGKLREWLEHQPHLPQGSFSFVCYFFYVLREIKVEQSYKEQLCVYIRVAAATGRYARAEIGVFRN